MNNLEILEQKFQDYAGDDLRLTFEEFQIAFELTNKYLCERLFHIFDADQTKGISFEEFHNGIHQAQENPLEFAFQLHDGNDDGCIDKQELAKFIRSSLREGNFDLSTTQLQQVRDILFEKADTNQNKEISLSEFKDLLSQSPRLKDILSVSPAQWLQPTSNSLAQQSQPEYWLQRWHYVQNNWIKLLFLALYFGINIALFYYAYRLPQYRLHTVWFRIARGCGLALNFNGALILVPILRRWMTWLRKTKLNDYLPIDEHLAFHKLVGQMIFALGLVHTVAHLNNHLAETAAFQIDYPVRLFLLYGSGWTGLLLMLLLLLMWFTALPFIREKGNFNLFFTMHLAYIPWIGLMLLHGPHFYKWAAVSIGAFLIEQVVRYRRSTKQTHIVNAQVLPSNVLALEIARPHDFTFKASDYLYLRCPHIATYEWHPFTISSPPEREDTLSLHIRALGSWTGTLYSQFRDFTEKRNGQTALPKIPVYLDGPYHSPSSHIYQSTYAVLIAGGIGVTPYASLLQSILHQRQAESTLLQLQKVHFYWFNRSQDSFEWLLEMLQRLEAEDSFDLFDLNLYLTGAPTGSNLQFLTTYAAFDLLHQEHQVDLITGLKNQIQAGRPNWNTIFTQLKKQYPTEPVDVYYCGPRGLSSTLRRQCYQHQFSYRKENF